MWYGIFSLCLNLLASRADIPNTGAVRRQKPCRSPKRRIRQKQKVFGFGGLSHYSRRKFDAESHCVVLFGWKSIPDPEKLTWLFAIRNSARAFEMRHERRCISCVCVYGHSYVHPLSKASVVWHSPIIACGWDILTPNEKNVQHPSLLRTNNSYKNVGCIDAPRTNGQTQGRDRGCNTAYYEIGCTTLGYLNSIWGDF